MQLTPRWLRRLKVLWKNVLVVTDPKAAAVVVGRGPYALDKAALFYAPVNEMVSPHAEPNLLTAPSDEKWHTIRKAVAVSFSHGNIRRKFPVVLEKVNELIARCRALGPSHSIDVDQAALRVTLDVIGLAGFQHDFECVKQDVPSWNHLLRVLPRCFTEVELRLANPFRSFGFLPRRFFTYGEKGTKSLSHFQDEMIALLDTMRKRGPPKHTDFSIGAQLLRLQNTCGITDDRILSEIGILFVEGFETTGHTISWTLFCIATTEGIQEKIAEELDNAGLLLKPNSSPRELVYEDLRKLSFLNSCLKEAMRMYPVVSVGNGRMTSKATRVGQYIVPNGVIVGVPLYALHNTKHNWEDPKSFKPERWLKVPVETFVYNSLDPEAKGSESLTFMPFSEGPRNCVGQSLAKMEVLGVLAKLLSNFRFTLAPEMNGKEGVTNRESTHLTLQTKGTKGIRMHLTPRDSPTV
jgi:cytochrome P450